MTYSFPDEFIDQYSLYRNIFKQVEIPEKYDVVHSKDINLRTKFLTIDKACSVTHMSPEKTLYYYNNSPDGRKLVDPFPFMSLRIQDYIAKECTNLFKITYKFITINIYQSHNELDPHVVETFLKIILSL